MNTLMTNVKINPKFKELFSFKNEQEKIEHNAQLLSFRILSEIEIICNEKGLKKKDLASLTGTSRSYITQLFTGSKKVNLEILAKLEEALDINVEFKFYPKKTKKHNCLKRSLDNKLVQA